MHIAVALPPILLLSVILSLADAKFYRPSQYILYKTGPNLHPYVHGKPTSRLKNHCAYVVEKTVSFTMQDGVAPYVKAQYNKCAWGQKCPTLIYHVMYKPVYKVAHKTLTELEWHCCPGYSGYGCMEGPPAYQHPIKAMPPFKGPPFKGPLIKGNPWSQSKGHPPMKSYPMLTKGPPMKGPPPMKSYPVKAKGPPPSNVKSYLIRPFGPPLTHPSYRGSSSKPYTFGPQHHHQPDHHEGPDYHQPELDHQGQDHQQPELDHQGSDYHHPELDHQGSDHHQPEPDHQGSDHHQPEPDHQRPDPHQPEPDHQGSDPHQPEPDHQGSDPHQPELDHQGPDHHQPELDHQGPDHHQPEPDHHWPDHHAPDHHQPEPDQEGPNHQEPDHQELDHHQPEPDLEPTNHQQPGPDHPDHPDLTDHPFQSELEPVTDETAPPAGSQEIDGQPLDTVDSESTERLDRMEEDVRRLSQGLETLRGAVNGLEDGLRASLWEDANRMLSALLSAAPSPVPALSSSPHSTVGFADIPGGDPDAEGLDGGQALPRLGELTRRVEELRTELQAKAAELEELRGSVIRNDGTLKKMSGGADSLTRAEARDSQKAMEDLVDAKLGGAWTEILGEFEKRVESAESRCGERAREVSRQCHREQQERQDLMELALEVSATGLRKELGYLQTQIQGHDLTEGCCGRVTGLGERVHLLEQLVAGLNQSQGHLRVELGGHKDHVEAMLEGRLEDVEAKLNLTECGKVKGGSASSSGSGGVQGSSSEGEVGAGSLETRLEGKLKALEGRLLTALGDLENATAPALLEGHVVPTLETEVESLRRRLEVDMDRVQKQLSGLELLCNSSSQPILQGDEATSNTHRVEEDKTGVGEEKGLLDMENNRLNSLNVTLQSLLTRLSQREDPQEGEEGSSVQGEIMLLKFNARSMNLTLKGLKDSVGLVVQDVGRANTTWQEREERLAQQVKGVVQLLGRQASMLGVGEKRLTRMKGELQELRRRLAGEVQGCRSTALGVQKEVVEVGGRVASVEGQCKGFSHLAKDLERIRAELERQSDGYLSQVNGTLTNHAHQLSELRQELRNCTWNAEPTQQSLYLLEPEQLREDQ
ncbi:EMILIN-3-like [Salvelinus sp. IW2-2015]|uniref:EMILIN-3-like n=1 Tax=Salvelinus sp. IW2-2015 TaxID=2691554 RepID=UPI000CDF9C65|nr:EMILIN-3-like [Salvelinus alpinus]